MSETERRDSEVPGEAAERSPRDLNTVQRWFAAVIMHPDGVAAGADSQTAQRLIRAGRDELERVVRRSEKLTAAERIGVYANAYYARLLEVLRNDFPVLTRTLGEEVFNGFAFGYLQEHPSGSYTLERLADRFADYLEETRPAETRGKLDWPDFLVELARLEWHIGQVFNGPGVEKMKTVTTQELAAIPAERFAAARMKPVVCLRLLSFRYPVNTYWSDSQRMAAGDHPAYPEPGDQHVALFRREYVVRRLEITPMELALLEALQSGETVGSAIERAAEHSELSDAELGEVLRGSFRRFTEARVFQSVEF